MVGIHTDNRTVVNSGNAVDKVFEFEPSQVQSLLVVNKGPDTYYIGEVDALDPSGLYYDTSGLVTGTSGLVYTNVGFPLVKEDTLGLTWQDFSPEVRGSCCRKLEMYGHCMSGASATVNIFGFYRVTW